MSDAQTIISAIDTQFVWTPPNADVVLPGLNDEMTVWGVQLSNPPAIPAPNVDGVALGYQLQLGPPAEPGQQAGRLHLYHGQTHVGTLALIQT